MAKSRKETGLFIGAVALLAIAGIATHRAVGGLLQIGSDEHYELTKAWLWTHGCSLYEEVWSDQPALLTVVLGFAFRTFGASIAVARWVAVCFGLSLVLAFGMAVRVRNGLTVALLGCFCLISAPEVLPLSASPMLEVPAIGTALWALWPLLKWEQKRQWAWVALSGAILAVALHIKLTAVVAVPALVAELVRMTGRTSPTNRVAGASHALGLWAGSLAAVYVGLGALVGTVPWDVLWGSHFSAGTLAHAPAAPALVAFWPRLWAHHQEAFWAGNTGLAMVLLRRDWGRMAFPLIWLLTAGLISLWHRPWWPYYYLHLAVPLAWVAGYGVVELWRLAWDMAGRGFAGLRWLAVCGGVAGVCLPLALVGVWGGNRVASGLAQIRVLPRVEDSLWVGKMQQYKDRTRWVYTRQTIYAFHAGLTVVPELAVLPHKRFWSGQIREDQVWATIKRYRPEQLLLEADDFGPGSREILEAGYRLVHAEAGLGLYVAKALVEQ